MSDIAKLVEILTKEDDTSREPLPWIDTWDWRVLDLPEFEILPREYLAYAEIELGQDDVRSRINCINHLKHALECQIDIFLYSWRMAKYAEKNRMLLHAKLGLLKDLGLVNARSATRLNLIRNKIEHEYARPKIEDLGSFYDVVSLLVAHLERASVGIDSIELFVAEGGMPISYSDEEPCITFEHDPIIVASLDDDKEFFIQCFRILFLFGDYIVRFIDKGALFDKLKEIPKVRVKQEKLTTVVS